VYAIKKQKLIRVWNERRSSYTRESLLQVLQFGYVKPGMA